MDLHLFSPESLLEQASAVPLERGYHRLKFFVEDNGTLAKKPTEHLADFYYSPSGGTLRDAEMNIVLYSAKFDKFKGIGRVE